MCPAKPDGHEQLKKTTIQILQGARRHPVPGRRLQREVARTVESFRSATLLSLMEELVADGMVTVLSSGSEREYFWIGNLAYLKERICGLVEAHHRASPYDSGMKICDIKKRFAETRTLNAQRNIDSRLFDLAMMECKAAGLVVEAECGVRRPSFAPKVRTQDELRHLDDRILQQVDEGFCVRLDPDALSRHFDVSAMIINSAVTRLVNTGVLLRLARHLPVKEYRYLRQATVESVKSALAREFAARPRMSTSEMRIALGLTRSTTIPLLEYLDSIGFTKRDGDNRLLARPASLDGRDGGCPGPEAVPSREGS